MDYSINNDARIKRPIFFLCGPYFNPNDDGDRRKILKDYLHDQCGNEVLPLIIDNFLSPKNIRDEKIDVQLMEEICAAVSENTLIFLDTISTATELGLFTNNTFAAPTGVIIPQRSDILNKDGIGFFVRESVLKPLFKNNVNVLKYRPSVHFNAKATDYLAEYYSFANNTIPENIRNYLLDQIKTSKNRKRAIIEEKTHSFPDKPFKICYELKGTDINIRISLKLLFYITVSVIEILYREELKKRNNSFSTYDISTIQNEVRDVFRNHISYVEQKNLSADCAVHILTKLNIKDEELFKHITMFVHEYNTKENERSVLIIPNPKDSFLKLKTTGKHPDEIFGLDDSDSKLIEDICNNKDKYYEEDYIIQKKKRKIVKYRDDEKGKAARRLHNKIHEAIKQEYKHDDHSYAYRENVNILDCVLKHVEGKGFLKFDIKDFFNSIDKEILIDRLIDELQIDPGFRRRLDTIISTCLYHKNLPLGLTLSPLLSDIYLHQFDKKIVEEAEQKGLVYTRYADDIMLSKEGKFNDNELERLTEFITNKLKSYRLKPNSEKKQSINFDGKHTFIRFLGIHIIDGGPSDNRITVGRSYINQLAKDMLIYFQQIDNYNSLPEDKKTKCEVLFYSRMSIIGRLGYLRMIENSSGEERLKRRIKKYQGSIPGVKEFFDNGMIIGL